MKAGHKKTGPKGAWSKTDIKVQKLLQALRDGDDRDSAVSYAEIPRSTFYGRMSSDVNFKTEVELSEDWRVHEVNNKKKQLINKLHWPAIEKELMSKRKKIYGNRLELAGDEENPLNVKVDLSGKSPKEIMEIIKQSLQSK